MTDVATVDAYGVLTEPATLTIQRLLPGPIERVWAYLTESDMRRKWLASGDMEMKVGAPFELVWRNSELTDPPGKRPEGFGEEHRMAEPHHRARPAAQDSPSPGEGSGDVTFELEPRGEQGAAHRDPSPPARPRDMLMVGAGWHMHLDILVARVSGREPAPFWDGWIRLRAGIRPAAAGLTER